MRVGVRFGQESKCPRLLLGSVLMDLVRRRRHVGILTSRVFFGLTDYAVCMWVSEWDDMSVGCGVFYCCWNDGDAP